MLILEAVSEQLVRSITLIAVIIRFEEAHGHYQHHGDFSPSSLRAFITPERIIKKKKIGKAKGECCNFSVSVLWTDRAYSY